MQIEIPDAIAEQVKNIIKDTKFSDIDSYVIYILQQVILDKKEKESQLSEDDKKAINEELKKMKYI